MSLDFGKGRNPSYPGKLSCLSEIPKLSREGFYDIGQMPLQPTKDSRSQKLFWKVLGTKLNESL